MQLNFHYICFVELCLSRHFYYRFGIYEPKASEVSRISIVVFFNWHCAFLANRTAEESTDSGDEVEKHVNNPLHEESISVHNYPSAPKQDATNMPSNEESFNQNDAILNIIEIGAKAPLSAVDDPKEKYLKNPIYEGSLEFQEDRFYERENYDCSQDDNDDYTYNALEQGSSPERDTASRSDSGSIARREENEEISSICDFPVARYDAVNRPCYKEGEDYDVLIMKFTSEAAGWLPQALSAMKKNISRTPYTKKVLALISILEISKLLDLTEQSPPYKMMDKITTYLSQKVKSLLPQVRQ